MTHSQYIFEVTTENFGKIVVEGSRSIPVLVDFWAEWCQPCKVLMPVLARLAEEFQGKFILAKINTEEQQAIAAEFGIRSIPTVKLFRGGEAVDEFMGALPESEIRAFLDRHIPRESDQLVSQANQLIQAGRTEDALRLIEQAHAEDPGNPRVQLAYARLKATLGEIETAERLLAELPMEEQEKPEVSALRARFLFDRVAGAAPAPAECEESLQRNPNDGETLYQLAAHKVMGNDYQGALELLLTLLQKNRQYGDDAARKGMLAVFEILGGSGDLVSHYRSRMFNALH